MTEMPDDIRDLLDELAAAKASLDNDHFDRLPKWREQFVETAQKLADAWANETADAPEPL